MSQDFERFLVVQKGLQPVTVAGHIKAVQRIEKKIGEITYEKSERYICELYQTSFSYSHKVNQATSLEYYFEHQGQKVRFGRQKKPKQIIKDTLTEAEIVAEYLSCKNIRERAILATLAYSGVRPKEFCRIRRRHINFGTNELTILNGKENKSRIIYISAECVNILVEYLAAYPKGPDDLMFTTADGLRPCNTAMLNKFMHTLARRAGIAKRTYTYILRHSLAINMINRGSDIFTIKNQLGHSLIETTLLYLNSLGYGLKNAYEKYCPAYTYIVATPPILQPELYQAASGPRTQELVAMHT